MLKAITILAVLLTLTAPSYASGVEQTVRQKIAKASTCTDARNACRYFCNNGVQASAKSACHRTCNKRQRACLRTGTYEWRTQANSVGLERR